MSTSPVDTPPDISMVLGVASKKVPFWRRWWVILTAVSVVALVAYMMFAPAKAVTYVKGKAEVATIKSVVTATGQLGPIKQTIIGAEVSGRIEEMFVDYNSPVKKGQIIARINSSDLNAKAMQADAAVQQSEASLLKANNDLARAVALRDRGFVSKAAYDVALAARNSAAANLKSTQAQADQAKVNLAKATIKSPIDGIVMDRKVELGQTMTAGFQTPEMFLITSDPAQLKLRVNIDEADIGDVALGQDATFTVDAFPSQVFHAKIIELRNISVTIQNVVSYYADLLVPNDKRLLKMGMTATADISVKSAESVISVPNGALRFTPQTTPVVETMAPQATVAPADPIASGKGTLWIDVKGKKPEPREVTLGITDGQRTQITSPNVKAGDEFILDIAAADNGSK